MSIVIKTKVQYKHYLTTYICRLRWQSKLSSAVRVCLPNAQSRVANVQKPVPIRTIKLSLLFPWLPKPRGSSLYYRSLGDPRKERAKPKTVSYTVLLSLAAAFREADVIITREKRQVDSLSRQSARIPLLVKLTLLTRETDDTSRQSQ